jgi:multimeric flavodoxin WrbA
LAINGSPRKGGNTEILLRKALEPIAETGHETDYLQVGGTRIGAARPAAPAGG